MKTITSGSVDRTALSFLDTAALPILAPISNALPEIFIAIVASF